LLGIKEMSGHFTHHKNMVWWKQHFSAECPQCRELQEDKAHIPQDSVNTQWDDAITNLTKWMKAENSAPRYLQW